VTPWHSIAPEDAVELDLTDRLDITAPLNRNSSAASPSASTTAPTGVIAGMAHIDYREEE